MANAKQVPSDADLLKKVDAALEAYLLRRHLPDSLLDAIRYAVFGGGKRVRPLLCLRSCYAANGEIESALPAACAIELIHTFSLVHDDLPAMDDDDLRRGRPTLHRHTNEAMAVLAGDSMTVLAFSILVNEIDDGQLASRFVHILSDATSNMIAGQVYDTMGGQPDEIEPIDRLRLTHRNKTGALLKASATMGAVAADTTEREINALSIYADYIGLMFQAVDDLLDVTQSTERMGKATGKDEEQGKLTYPGLLGIEGTRVEIQKLLDQSLDALSGFDTKADPLRDLANKLATRER